MKPQTFKRSKNSWTDEQSAQNDVLQKQYVTAEELTAEHTETHFVWNRNPPEELHETAFFAWPMSFDKEKHTEQLAIATAIEEMKTFEGNLKRDDTETHYVFSKVRQD